MLDRKAKHQLSRQFSAFTQVRRRDPHRPYQQASPDDLALGKPPLSALKFAVPLLCISALSRRTWRVTILLLDKI